MTNKDLLYSTGNSAQWYVAVWMGGEFGGEFSSVQFLSHVPLLVTPWTIALQDSRSITNSWSLLKLMSIELVMPSNHLILGENGYMYMYGWVP